MKKNHRPGEKRRVAVLVDTSTTWGRGIIAGIRDYAHRHSDWALFVEPRGIHDAVRIPPSWHGHGIIARVVNSRAAAYLSGQEMPVVNVSSLQLSGPQLPRVSMDVEEAARMAAKYFLERGFRNFGYVSLAGLECVARQRRAFGQAVREAGFSCSDLGIQLVSETLSAHGEAELAELLQWLKDLPRPVAILTFSGGQEIIECCEQAGLDVPEEVSLLSGSNDDLLCEISSIPISAINQPVEQIGFQAAAMLDKLMGGKPVPARPVQIAPLSITTRQSTNTLAVSDRWVVSALRFIHDHAHEPIRVTDVATAVGLSRRVLERRFATMLRRTPGDYIRRAHLDKAKTLLAQTDQPIATIAERSGFPSQQYLTYMLRRDTGMSPLKYRKHVRG